MYRTPASVEHKPNRYFNVPPKCHVFSASRFDELPPPRFLDLSLSDTLINVKPREMNSVTGDRGEVQVDNRRADGNSSSL